MFDNFDKKILRLNFEQGAKNYEKCSPIQNLAASKLCKIAKPFIAQNSQILDLGSGTGFISKELKTPIFETDLAFEMLNKNKKSSSIKVQSDFENLPFKDNSFDVLISSFSLQWLCNFNKSFAHFFSLLKENGFFIFCLPCDGSLSELKSANIFSFNQLPEAETIKKSLQESGFSEVFFEKETFKQSFESGVDAIKSIKKIGANYSKKNQKIITKTDLLEFNKNCLKNFGTNNRKIEISWLVSYFIFRK
jgi:malonyl-CoA O-methyltransferase